MTGALGQLAQWPVPNAAAAVIGAGGVLATAGDTARVFGLASVTKPLSALAALVAVEEGALGLTDQLREQPGIDPRLAGDFGDASLAHLLAHASGMASDPAYCIFDNQVKSLWGFRNFLEVPCTKDR